MEKNNVPFELVEPGDERIGQDEVVVDEFAIRATRAIRDTPTQVFLGAGQDLADATAVLQADLIGMDMVTEAAGLDDGEEAPANLGLFLLGELDRDDTRREGTIQKGPQPFAHAGGIDDDVLRVPGFGQALSLPKTVR